MKEPFNAHRMVIEKVNLAESHTDWKGKDGGSMAVVEVAIVRIKFHIMVAWPLMDLKSGKASE